MVRSGACLCRLILVRDALTCSSDAGLGFLLDSATAVQDIAQDVADGLYSIQRHAHRIPPARTI